MRRRDLALATLFLVLAWQLLSWILRVEVLPGPVAVLRAFGAELSKGLAWHFLVSGWRVAVSIVISMALAVPVGVGAAIYLVEYARRGSRFVRLWPHRHQTDGFFAAVWQRR